MADLATTYLGLELRNPIIVGSCGFTKDLDGVRSCADAGAGAVVLNSVFEEQIREDFADFEGRVAEGLYHPEAYEYFRADLAARYGAHDYCQGIEAMREAVDIPVIASINCFSGSAWESFAQDVENAGASALELNIGFPPVARLEQDPESHVREMAAAVATVTNRVRIPVTVKLPPAGGYVYRLAARMAASGAKGLVLFNRFLVPEIDTDRLEIVRDVTYSSPSEAGLARRYVALLARRLPCDLVAAGGVHDVENALGMLLAGARAVQVVSALYLEDVGVVGRLRDGIAAWMDRHGFGTLEDFRGRFAAGPGDLATPFGRFHYVQTLGEAPPMT